MARPPREAPPGGLFHVTALGVAGTAIFVDDRDRRRFLRLLGEVVGRHGWLCEAYCLMTTHFHLVVQTPRPDLPSGMHRLNAVYAQGFNRRHSRVGHLFGDRYFSTRIRRDAHALEIHRYLALNPVKAGLCEQPSAWFWSSYGAVAGQRTAEPFLSEERALARFGRTREAAVRRLRAFVEEM
jgi:putative transposase